MPDPIARHIATIVETDGRGTRETARNAAYRVKLVNQYEEAAFEPVRKSVAAIRRHITRKLAPHRVEFKSGAGYHISGIDGSTHISLWFEVWPHMPGATSFKSHARTPITVNSMGARDAHELAHILTGLKDAADRLALMLFTPSGARTNA